MPKGTQPPEAGRSLGPTQPNSASGSPAPQNSPARTDRPSRPSAPGRTFRGSRPSQRGGGGGGAGVPTVLLVTDPGPDPDDIKTLLVLAILHQQRELDLCAVVCNGGGQPEKRARLARCILDSLGERAVPVGIGSMGRPYTAQAHEYHLAAYAQVDERRLLPGAELMRGAIAAARPCSMTVVCISSLRDFADCVRADEALVLNRVECVAVMGGLDRDPATGGYVPDTSVNNEFDPEAAAFVYGWCFREGVPLTVVSRHAVPMLPMQLARSFAVRTDSEVLRYLADAQFLGLEGLWQKLCEGKLPARCSKEWYCETFCAMDGAAFEAQRMGELDASADIRSHLQGFVKPYGARAAPQPRARRAAPVFAPGRARAAPLAAARQPTRHLTPRRCRLAQPLARPDLPAPSPPSPTRAATT
jgi:hypothetical protein